MTVKREIQLGSKRVGDNRPTYIVAEIGINHNGSVDLAKLLIEAARNAGVDAVKFQKRTPDLCVPPEQRDKMRDTPWGYISYLDYRYRIEFGEREYREIADHCRRMGIDWFASTWDIPAVDFMEGFDPICYKVPSALLTDHALLRYLRSKDRPVILSTGMSTLEQICAAVTILGTDNLLIAHSTSAYPCDPGELNLLMIKTLMERFPCPIGYSGHEVGLIPSVLAAGLGACLVERHITLDRAMWGSDQAASVEPDGFRRLVKYLRVTELALGDGVKKVYESEKPSMLRLRRAV
jgi:N-acetylneuraminate synthase